MSNQVSQKSLYERRQAAFFKKNAENAKEDAERLKKDELAEKERVRQECHDAACTLIYRMKVHGLPAAVRISDNAHAQLRKRRLRSQTSARKALLEKLAHEGGVPAKKVHMNTNTTRVGLPFWQIEILP